MLLPFSSISTFPRTLFTIAGMLSKSKGQILRVSAVLHVLFHIDTPPSIPQTISEDAVKAADNFVDLCLQHAASLAGRGNMQEAVGDIQEGIPPWRLGVGRYIFYVHCR